MPMMIRQILLNLFRALIGAYGISVSAFIALRLLVGEAWTMVAFFNTFAHLLWIPALILLPVTLLSRMWRLSALLMAPALAFLLTYGERFLPRASAETDDPSITLLTYNLHSESALLDPMLQIILEADADMVLLQDSAPRRPLIFRGIWPQNMPILRCIHRTIPTPDREFSADFLSKRIDTGSMSGCQNNWGINAP